MFKDEVTVTFMLEKPDTSCVRYLRNGSLNAGFCEKTVD
jgi:hypothetical protein